ncbi:MAG: acyl-CoA desaturase [Candidatus Taylorbacteria bacterium]|nr:acyl-CoA desaturase [Candidatus Taylorbacteria bacterium]
MNSDSRSGPSAPKRFAVLAVIIVPFVGFLYACLTLWQHGYLEWFYIILALVFYVLTGLGITVGFHRLFTHESFVANPSIRFLLAVLGSMAFQGSIIDWCTRHADHHQASDKPRDPHSPWKYGVSFWNLLKGVLHAQFMWLLKVGKPPENKCYKRLISDPIVSLVDSTTWFWMLTSAFLPAVLGHLYDPEHGFLKGFLWGSCARLFLLQHVTWAINSYCHIWGKRRFRSGDLSTDSYVFGILAFGEGFHNGHHAFPRSALHGIDTPWLDLSYAVIRALKRAGLAKDVIIPSVDSINGKRR